MKKQAKNLNKHFSKLKKKLRKVILQYTQLYQIILKSFVRFITAIIEKCLPW